jgi:hypothetical protein
MKHNPDLELEFHPCDVLSNFRVHQFLDVGVQTAGSDLSVATDHSFKQRIMDKYVLVLRLSITKFLISLIRHEINLTVHING